MILLRHLRISAFKHLRNIDLWLPRHGSVLIEGHNESGKSTLFEAIYFALYGRTLVGEDQRSTSLEPLLPHGESWVGVQLMISAGATELEITRTLTRGPKQVKHDAEVRIIRPGRPVETISAVKAVNDCILTEMNGLDGAVLRNSCLMEQQALDRIEALSTADREMAIAKLLGIDAIQRIEQDLKVVKKDNEGLAQAKIRLDVAHKQQEAQQATEMARTTETRLRAAKARTALLARDQGTTQLQATQADLDSVAQEASQIRERSRRVATLEALLTRSEENGLLLREAEQQATAMEMMRARQGHIASTEEIAAAQTRVAMLRQLEVELQQATQASNAAGKSQHLAQAEADVVASEEREQALRERLATTEQQVRRAVLLTALALLGAIASALGVALVHLQWLLATMVSLALAGIIEMIHWGHVRSLANNERAKLATLERETLQLRATHEAVRRLGVGAGKQTTAIPSSPEAEAAQQALSDIQNRIRALNIEPGMTPLAAERIAAEQILAQMMQQAGTTPETLTAQQRNAAAARDACAQALRETAAALTSAGIAMPSGNLALQSVADMRRTHEEMQQPLQAELARLDVQATQRQRGSLDIHEQHLRARRDELIAQQDIERQRLVALLAEEGIAAAGDEPLEALVNRWPALANESDPDALAAALERASAIEERLCQQVAALCQQHGLDADTLDAEACQKAYDELDQDLRQRRLAAEMADEVFRRIVKRVLPETEMHMRALLPDLTDGRYRDVRLLNDDGDSANLEISIWDEQAERYVGKNLFSGGTRDQVSLALRLAFALATLPQELGAMPGFIFLDEPLSSFDDRRSQALVDVLTRGPIAHQFPQVFLISHSQSFDPGAFTCSLRMSGGRIAATTLPDEDVARTLWQED